MSKCPVCGWGPEKVGRHVDCAVKLRADEYERSHFGPEKPDCMWLLSYGDRDTCTSPGRKVQQVSAGHIDTDMAPLAVCFDCLFYFARAEAGTP